MKAEDLLKDVENLEKRIFGNPEESAPKSEEPTEVVEPSMSEEVDSSSEDISTEDTSTTEKKKYTDWKNRFKTCKAASDATIHKLRQDVISLTQEIEALSKENEELRKKVTEFQSNTSVDFRNQLSEEERDLVGEETLSTVQKLTKAAVESAVNPLKSELERERKLRLEAQRARAEAMAAENSSSFEERLGELAPNYKLYDTDKGFHEWMSEPDTVSGIVRSVIFKNAQHIGDVAGVSRFFNEYDNLQTSKTKELDANITPSKTATPQQTSPKEKQEVLTFAFIDKFYDDCIKGKYKGKEQLRKEISDRIDEALAKNLVR